MKKIGISIVIVVFIFALIMGFSGPTDFPDGAKKAVGGNAVLICFLLLGFTLIIVDEINKLKEKIEELEFKQPDEPDEPEKE